VNLVLDSGAFVALERNDRALWRRLKAAHARGSVPLSHGGVIGQVWRGGGPRQTLLAKALDGIEVRPLDDAAGRAAGGLLKKAGLPDVIDAALTLLAGDGDQILTSDVDDIEPLAEASGRSVEIIRV